MESTNQPQNTEIRSRRDREPFIKETNQPTMIEAVKTVFNKYADFTGRARRSEYWYFQLFNFIVTMGLYVCMIPFAVAEEPVGAGVIGFLIIIYLLATIIPSLAVIARRLHDTGRSGWTYLMGFIPLVGGIILLIYFIEDSKPGPNQWGLNPKGIGNDGHDEFNN